MIIPGGHFIRICFFLIFFGMLPVGCQFIGTIANGTHKIYTVLADDRSLADDVSDIRINLEIRDALARHKGSLAFDIDVTVFEGEVLLTGAIPDILLIHEAIATAWSVAGVRKVYTYIRLNEPLSVDEVARDAAVAAKVRTELGLTKGVASSNYKLVVENKTAYLMGIRASDAEYETALAVLKNSVGIDQVICLMR